MTPEPDPQSGPQAAIAAFTLFALTTRSIAATIERSISVTQQVLSAPMGAVLQLAGPGRLTVVDSRGPTGAAPGDTLDVDDDLITAQASLAPLTVGDRSPANGRPGPSTTGEPHARAQLSVCVQVAGKPWGRLLVSDTEPRAFTDADVDFVQAIAAVLAAALELERVDSDRAALAAFGRFALESADLSTIVVKAVDVVMRVLDAPIGSAVRVSKRAGKLAVVHAAGSIGLRSGDEYEVDHRLVAALGTPEPLIIRNWVTDDRFTTPLMPRSTHALSSAAAAIPVGGRIWGWLMVCDTVPRQFTASEVHRLSSVADLLAAALQRKRVEWAQAGAARLSSAHHRSTPPVTEVALLDTSGVIVWVNHAWQEFCRDNDGDPARTGVGVSYLACCEAAGDPVADQVADAIRAAAAGDLPAPMRVVIPCHSPRTDRWFDVLISSRLDDQGSCIGVAVTLSLTSG